MKDKINTISITCHTRPNTVAPFVSVNFHRGGRVSSSTFHPTPSTMRRVMQWQAATYLAGYNMEQAK